MSRPDAVRNPWPPEADEPFVGCPPDTPMTLYKTTPKALRGETVAAWLLRTADTRKQGFSVGLAEITSPFDVFGIGEWIDPSVSPLPKEKEHIWSEFRLRVDGAFVNGKFERGAPDFQAPPLKPVAHELVVVVDVRAPLTFVTAALTDAVQKHRQLLIRVLGESGEVLNEGKSTVNPAGVFEAYVQILQRLDGGETMEDVRRRQAPSTPKLAHYESAVEQMKKRIPRALALRDGGYKFIAYQDDFLNRTKRKS